jgi:ubiquinone/menaquinone biosynthesis C-methylase UbiE
MKEDKSNPELVYKAFAEYYDAYVADFEADFEIYLRMIKPGLKVLEIGCGTGRVLKPLLESGASIIGVDISHEMLVLARNKLGGFYDKNETARLLREAGFSSVKFADTYDSALFHQLEPLETTDRGFLVMARRETGEGEG